MFGRTRRAVRARVAEAELPQVVARCIEQVARSTRLRPAEQIDVASELASHFREGLAAGRSADELVRDFGDVRRSARDIRRATIAKRHVADRIIGGACMWSLRAGSVLVAGYLAWAVSLQFREPVISFDGRAAIEATRPKPGAEGRAIDLYREAFAGADGAPRTDLGDREIALEALVTRMGYDGAARVEAQAILAEFAPQLAILRRLRERPVLGMPLTLTSATEPALMRFFHPGWSDESLASPAGHPLVDGSMLGILLPQLATTRSGTRLLVLDAAIAAAEGRTADFMVDIESALASARHAGECDFLIGLLVECAQRTLIAHTVVSAIENHGERFDDASLSTLRAWMADNQCDIGRGFEAEELLVRDVLQRVYSDDGSGDGVLLAHAASRWERMIASDATTKASRKGVLLEDGAGAMAFLLSPVAASLAPSRAEVRDAILSHYGRLRELSRSADPDAARAELVAIDREFEARKTGPWAVLEWIVPGLARAALQPRALRASSDAAVAAIALEQFRRAERRWPADLAELERFVGRPLGGAGGAAFAWRYAVVDGRPLIHDPGIDLLDDRARALHPDRGVEGAQIARLSGLPGDGAVAVGADGRVTNRREPTFAPDSLLQPGCALEPAQGGAADGDVIRVWWKSRASGPQREVPACE